MDIDTSTLSLFDPAGFHNSERHNHTEHTESKITYIVGTSRGRRWGESHKRMMPPAAP